MKSATVPSLGVKGNGIGIGLTDGTIVAGCHYGMNYGGTLGLSKEGYGYDVGVVHPASVPTSSYKSVGFTTDASKSGIITNTGTMSNITSRLIIKY